MLGSWQLEVSLQVTLVVAPVAVYFLILGLLNSQTRPQMLSGRLDFSLLMASISPLLLVPLLSRVGMNPWTILLALAAVTGIILLLAPRPQKAWIIYNISLAQALGSVERALRQSGVAFHRHGQEFHLDDGASLRLSAFPLLRNISLTANGTGEPHRPVLRRFEAGLARQLGSITVTASPMAVSFVLISTVMIVAPLVLLANRMPEMVRIISDMIGQ